MKIIHKYYLLLCFFSFSFLSVFSYGFIKDLYFWNEDYVFIKSFYTHELIYPFYQGSRLIIYPLFLLFKDTPMGYFISALVLYILLSFTVSLFTYFFTKNKFTAFIAGILFSSGYVGSEHMQMVATAIPQTLYMILAFLAIIFYAQSFVKKSVKFLFFSLCLFIFSIVMVPDRAFTLIPVMVLTEIYLCLSASNKAKKSFFLQLKEAAKRLSLFLVSFVCVYYKYGGGSSIGFLAFDPDKFNTKANLNFFAEIGGYLFPSDLSNLLAKTPTQSFVLSSSFGILLLVILFVFVYLLRKDKRLQKLLLFLALSWFITYYPYHWKESSYLHASTFRYIFFAYPFFTMMVALIITKFFSQSKTGLVRFTGFFLVGVIISLNLIAGHVSAARKFRSERSFYLKKFLPVLKKQVPQLGEMNLFYFDVTSNPPVRTIFTSFFVGGRASAEASLGLFYHKPSTIIKFATDYDDFVSEYKTKKYSNVYAFYYANDHTLINVSSRMFSQSADGSDTAVLHSSAITSVSELVKTKNEEKQVNMGLSIDIADFPSYRPVRLDIDMKLDSLGNDMNIYPYPFEMPVVSNLTRNADKRRVFLDYIIGRNAFKKYVKIQTSESLDASYTAEQSVDNDLETSWIANKQKFFGSGNAWIEIAFPQDQDISEIRWISGYSNRVPINYDYQIPEGKEGSWKTILSIRNGVGMSQKYVVDTIPKVTSGKMRMVIYKTTGDSPAITEIEALQQSSGISSGEADTVSNYPLAGIQERSEAVDIMAVMQDYQKMKLYPLTNKMPNKNQVHPLYIPVVLDGGSHHYAVTLPASGTSLNTILVEFPHIPVSAGVNAVTLTSLPL